MSNFLDETGVSWIFNKIKSVFVTTEDTDEVNPVLVDQVPTEGSDGLVTSGGVYDALHPTIQNEQPSTGMLPNIIYDFGTITASPTVTFNLDTTNISSGLNHYFWMFDVGVNSAPTINWPSGLTWVHGSSPAIAAATHYEISVINNIATAIKVSL